MTAITADQARQLGRNKVPLRLIGLGRTLVLANHGAPGCRSVLLISVEIRGRDVACQFEEERPSRHVDDDAIAIQTRRGAFFDLASTEEDELVTAWLDGYYAAAEQGEPS